MKHIVNISGGMASAVCLFRVLERFGRDDVIACFADVRQEHADCYRFIDDVERVSGVQIERLGDGRNCWDVWLCEMMLTNQQSGGCLASYHLKKKVLAKHAASVATPETATIYIGFGPDEEDRQQRIRKASEWNFNFPLCWPQRMWRCDLADDLRSRGIAPPTMYAEGYPHANCAGACILAGATQWAGLLKDNPKLYAFNEAKEQEFLAELRNRNRKEVTILKDRRGGETRNLSLMQLREELESGIRDHDDSWRASACNCMMF